MRLRCSSARTANPASPITSACKPSAVPCSSLSQAAEASPPLAVIVIRLTALCDDAIAPVTPAALLCLLSPRCLSVSAALPTTCPLVSPAVPASTRLQP